MSETKQALNKRYDPIVSGETVEFHAIRPNRYGESSAPAHIVTHCKIALDPRAEFALRCVEKWGIIMGSPDGENASGRIRTRPMPIDEVVARACDMADKAYGTFKERGWIIALPTLQEMADAVKDKESTNE